MDMRIPGKHPLDDLTEEELQKMSDMTTEFRKNPLTGFKEFFASIFKPMHKRDPLEATYGTFKAYYDTAGLPFTKEDAKKVRANMLRLSEKLYELHVEETEEVDAEIERKQKDV